MRTLTASDRDSLIKLANSLPKGDETRKAILAGLSVSKTSHFNPFLAKLNQVLAIMEESGSPLCRSLRKEIEDYSDLLVEETELQRKSIQVEEQRQNNKFVMKSVLKKYLSENKTLTPEQEFTISATIGGL